MQNEKENRKNPEQQFDAETLREMSEKQSEKLRENKEQAAEKVTERQERLDEARHEALEQAHREKERSAVEIPPQNAPERRVRIASRKERDVAFDRTMNDIRPHLSSPSRVFSQFIHNKTVENVSNFVGGTVARPTAILSGALFAFLLTSSVLIIARRFGYQLSGFESIAAFLFGWGLGLIYDFLRIMITGKKN